MLRNYPCGLSHILKSLESQIHNILQVMISGLSRTAPTVSAYPVSMAMAMSNWPGIDSLSAAILAPLADRKDWSLSAASVFMTFRASYIAHKRPDPVQLWRLHLHPPLSIHQIPLPADTFTASVVRRCLSPIITQLRAMNIPSHAVWTPRYSHQ